MTTAPVTWFDRPLDTSGHICDMIRGKKKSSSITQRRREREEKKKKKATCGKMSCVRIQRLATCVCDLTRQRTHEWVRTKTNTRLVGKCVFVSWIPSREQEDVTDLDHQLRLICEIYPLDSMGCSFDSKPMFRVGRLLKNVRGSTFDGFFKSPFTAYAMNHLLHGVRFKVEQV